MTAGDLRDQIAQIEADIEQLVDLLERCRKAMVLSKIAIGAGALWITAYVFGAIRFEPMTMIGAIAAIIEGIVVYGSNSSTAKGTTAEITDAERLRADLIDKIDPQTVGRSNQSLSE